VVDTTTPPVTVVTGAASGIGLAVTRLLASQDRAVVATDIDPAGLERLRREAAAEGWSITTRGLDVSDPHSVAEMFAELLEPPIGAVVHCAGITVRTTLLDMSPEAYDRIIATNLTGSFLVMTGAGRSFRAQDRSGSIVVITSINAERPLPSQAVYSAAKAAIDVLVRSLALELGPAGVRVNAIAPGAIDTTMNPSDAADPGAARRVPLGRIGTAEEVARSVLFMLSDDASYITGASLTVDGGLVHVRP